MSGIKYFPLDSRAATTSLKQPKEICYFSRNLDGDYVNDDSSLAYFFLPDTDIDTNLDLGGGFSKFKKFDENRDGEFDGLLDAIKSYEERKDTKVKADIITWRGIMTKLLILPYNNRDHLDLNIVWFDGHIFIQQDKVSQKIHEQTPTIEVQKMMYSGYKFENVSTISEPLQQATRTMIEKRSKRAVNNIEQYCSVVRTGVGKQKIIIGGEVDCVWDYKPKDSNPLSHYMELKTSKIITEPGQTITFERKLFRTWAQCFLLGISKIIYGFRDDNLILRSVEQYNTDEIPVLLKSNPINTNPKKLNCIDTLKWYGAVVEWLAKEIPHDESKSWKLKFDPNQKTLSLQENTTEISSQLLNGGIIPNSFKQWRLQKRA